MLSCLIPEHLRQELDRFWAEQGLRPHGRTQQAMEQMIRDYLSWPQANPPELDLGRFALSDVRRP